MSSISQSTRQQVISDAKQCCEYCQTQQRLIGMPLVIDHINPRQQTWSKHFAWTEDGVIITGLTATGRTTVNALKLNNEYVVESRRIWVAENWHPPNF